MGPGAGKIPWRRAWQLTPVFLPGESYGQRSLAGYSPQGHKESDMMSTHMIELTLPKRCVEIPTPRSYECELMWTYALCRCNQVKRESSGEALIQHGCTLLGGEKPRGDRPTGRRSCDDGGRLEGSSREPRGPEHQRPPPAAARDEAGVHPGSSVREALWALGSVRRYVSVAFSHSLGGTLL